MTPQTDWIVLLREAAQPVVFAGLFIWLLMREREASGKREEWFRIVVEKYGTNLTELTSAVRDLVNRVERVERQLDSE